VTAQRIRDEQGPPITGQILIYPVTDHRDSEMASYDEFAEGMGLTREEMKWFWDQYLEDQREAKDPKAAPLLSENLTKLPPALVIIAGYDPVRDEGIAYSNRMTEAGVDVRLLVYDDMIHGFLSYLGILSQGKNAIGEIAKWIKG
jgi:acetyl esterase